MTPVRLEPATLRSRVKHSTTGPLRSQRKQETIYQTADAADSIRQQMQETLYQTADAGGSPSDSGCRSLSIRQQMQETLIQTADAGDYQKADAGDSYQTADEGDSL